MMRLLCATLLCVWLGPSVAGAHDRDVATFVISPVATKATADRPAAKGWMMEMHVPTVALHTALVGELGKATVEALSETAYKERAVDYLWRHIEMKTDTPVLLGGGGIKLGPHQTDLRFSLRRLTTQGELVWVKIDAFTEDGHQSNVLKVRGAKPRTVVLTAENQYAAVAILKR